VAAFMAATPSLQTGCSGEDDGVQAGKKMAIS
jgi:hypothetical protein